MQWVEKIRNSELWRAISDIQMAWDIVQAIGIGKLASALVTGALAWFGAVSYVPPVFAAGFGIFIATCVLWLLNGLAWWKDRDSIRKSKITNSGSGSTSIDSRQQDIEPTYYKGRELDIRDLIVQDFRVINKTFEGCTIKGPACVIFIRTQCIECNFVGTPISVPIPLDTAHYREGMLLVKDCTFKKCTFRLISLAMTKELMLQFLSNTAQAKDGGD